MKNFYSEKIATQITEQCFVTLWKSIDLYSEEKHSFFTWTMYILKESIEKYCTEKHYNYFFILHKIRKFDFQISKNESL